MRPSSGKRQVKPGKLDEGISWLVDVGITDVMYPSKKGSTKWVFVCFVVFCIVVIVLDGLK